MWGLGLQMDLCGWTSQRVAPEAGSSMTKPRSPPPRPRVNGWSRPIHTPPVVVWTSLLALAFTGFGIFIPLLPYGLKLVAYSVSFSLDIPNSIPSLGSSWAHVLVERTHFHVKGLLLICPHRILNLGKAVENVIFTGLRSCALGSDQGQGKVTGGLLLFHLVVLVATITIDPAEPNVRRKNYRRPRTIFDRSKLLLFTETRYCHLCGVTVSARAKHCRACNKCTAGFDHHCKWLNNCVGSRNYWWFFTSVLSAVACLLCLMAVVTHVMIIYWVDQEALRSDPQFQKITDENTWLLFLPFIPLKVKAPVLLTIGAAVLVLVFSGLLILGYLFVFHVYIREYRQPTPGRKVVVQAQGARNPVEGKEVVDGDLATGVESFMLSGSFNLDALSIKRPPSNLSHSSLMPQYSAHSGISFSSTNLQSVPQRSQKPCSSTSRTLSLSSHPEEEQVIRIVDPLPHDQLPEDTEEEALCRATSASPVAAGPLGAQGQSSSGLCPVLNPDPGSPSGDALETGVGTVLRIQVIPMDNASEISDEGDLPTV
ncbi:palmitoyltransferase ZDHHC11-like [Loxodonta africana]|uniref:palmitoyltransferase ZDHHC11-like n=1 Tax=Loxodonta africana TaxID=9785 RepID=UPI0030D5DC4F